MADVVVRKDGVLDNQGTVIQATEKLKIALFRVGDRFAAIQNRCPHAGASLADGPFDGTLVKCPLHGFKVDVWQGIGSAGKRVKTYPVSVNGDEVVIAIPDEGQS
jgi:nitrite reductase/ring-hydroxylating ferredoxin subunit